MTVFVRMAVARGIMAERQRLAHCGLSASKAISQAWAVVT